MAPGFGCFLMKSLWSPCRAGILATTCSERTASMDCRQLTVLFRRRFHIKIDAVIGHIGVLLVDEVLGDADHVVHVLRTTRVIIGGMLAPCLRSRSGCFGQPAFNLVEFWLVL